MAQPKSKSVSVRLMLRLNTTFAEVVEVMFACEIIFFFERLKEFLKEFKKIRYFMPDDDFLNNFKKGPFVCNDLFSGLIMSRLYGPRKPIPLYLDDMTLYAGLHLPNEVKPMKEKHFFALWYGITVDPQKMGIIEKDCLDDKSKRYHFSFDSGNKAEDRFAHTFYVIFEYKDNKWHYDAYHYYRDIPITPSDGRDMYIYLLKK
jgi:hypothetical protein